MYLCIFVEWNILVQSSFFQNGSISITNTSTKAPAHKRIQNKKCCYINNKCTCSTYLYTHISEKTPIHKTFSTFNNYHSIYINSTQHNLSLSLSSFTKLSFKIDIQCTKTSISTFTTIIQFTVIQHYILSLFFHQILILIDILI